MPPALGIRSITWGGAPMTTLKVRSRASWSAASHRPTSGAVAIEESSTRTRRSVILLPVPLLIARYSAVPTCPARWCAGVDNGTPRSPRERLGQDSARARHTVPRHRGGRRIDAYLLLCRLFDHVGKVLRTAHRRRPQVQACSDALLDEGSPICECDRPSGHAQDEGSAGPGPHGDAGAGPPSCVCTQPLPEREVPAAPEGVIEGGQPGREVGSHYRRR